VGRPILLFLVNGEPDSAIGIRARSFGERLRSDFRVHVAYRSTHKIYSILRFFWLLLRRRPALCYVIDIGYSGVLAASLYRMISRCRVAVDTGDAIYELGRNSGRRGIRLWLTRRLEELALSISDRVVVRSHPYQEWLASRGKTADVIPDGVDTAEFAPSPVDDLRRQYGLEGYLVVGLVGSLIWNHRWQMCYGWELIELIDQLRDRPVKGFIIGDGSGLQRLRAQCVARGLENRIVFTGRIAYDDLPRYLSLLDVCLSTQTNDTAGRVRTTGKLPLYLACGRFVLASALGEAARVLPTEMLVQYNGTKDNEYPSRLAARVQMLLEHPEYLQQREASILIAQTHFDYNFLAARLKKTIFELLPDAAPPGAFAPHIGGAAPS
jgi:glycosyltransferase involved in cell wall biosynthesis